MPPVGLSFSKRSGPHTQAAETMRAGLRNVSPAPLVASTHFVASAFSLIFTSPRAFSVAT